MASLRRGPRSRKPRDLGHPRLT